MVVRPASRTLGRQSTEPRVTTSGVSTATIEPLVEPSPPSALPPGQLARPTTRTESSEEDLWKSALEEFESQSRRPGLWAKSFAEARGNESAAKASYLGARVGELAAERQAEQLHSEQKRRELARAQLARISAECPSCGKIISMADEMCPNCRASFAPGSPYRLAPMKDV